MQLCRHKTTSLEWMTKRRSTEKDITDNWPRETLIQVRDSATTRRSKLGQTLIYNFRWNIVLCSSRCCKIFSILELLQFLELLWFLSAKRRKGTKGFSLSYLNETTDGIIAANNHWSTQNVWEVDREDENASSNMNHLTPEIHSWVFIQTLGRNIFVKMRCKGAALLPQSHLGSTTRFWPHS